MFFFNSFYLKKNLMFACCYRVGESWGRGGRCLTPHWSSTRWWGARTQRCDRCPTTPGWRSVHWDQHRRWCQPPSRDWL